MRNQQSAEKQLVGPAEAGVQAVLRIVYVDSGFHRNDESGCRLSPA